MRSTRGQRQPPKYLSKQRRKRFAKGSRASRSPAVLMLILLVWSICLGWGLSLVLSVSAQTTAPTIGTVDAIPARFALGKELYLENCATCHIGIAPEVLPSETWRRLLMEPEQHYGVKLEPLVGPSQLVMWDYLRTFSRPLQDKEAVPYRVAESRFFKALHPRVKFPQPAKIGSCVTCHPGVGQFNYRTLTPEWENSP